MTTSRELVAAVGGHPCTELGLDLGQDTGLWHWLVGACLLSAPRERALAAWRALLADGSADLSALAGSEATRLALRLEAAGMARPERVALTLVRAARALLEHHGGSLSALLDEAGDLACAGEALVGLAPGLGTGTALRFLRPLRQRVPGAEELPLAGPARAAAVCLGWIAPDADPLEAFAKVARQLRDEADADPLCDVEAALEALGAAACAKARAARCPLALACALRYRQEP